MTTPSTPRERRSAMPGCERGTATTAWFALVVVAILAVAGLVVDGGAQAVGARRAETAAQAAARAGADAAAAARLAGTAEGEAARATAQAHLARMDVSGTATVVGDVVRVRTTVTLPTTFLSLVGVSELTARGDADARLRRR